MIKPLAVLGLFFSLNAFAGYQCELNLSHTDDTHTTLTTHTISASSRDMRSEMIHDLLIESQGKRKKKSLTLKTFIDGWNGEEEVTLEVYRQHQKDTKIELSMISDKVSLRGNAQDTLWFDTYKLEINCSLV